MYSTLSSKDWWQSIERDLWMQHHSPRLFHLHLGTCIRKSSPGPVVQRQYLCCRFPEIETAIEFARFAPAAEFGACLSCRNRQSFCFWNRQQAGPQTMYLHGLQPSACDPSATCKNDKAFCFLMNVGQIACSSTSFGVQFSDTWQGSPPLSPIQHCNCLMGGMCMKRATSWIRLDLTRL